MAQRFLESMQMVTEAEEVLWMTISFVFAGTREHATDKLSEICGH